VRIFTAACSPGGADAVIIQEDRPQTASHKDHTRSSFEPGPAGIYAPPGSSSRGRRCAGGRKTSTDRDLSADAGRLNSRNCRSGARPKVAVIATGDDW